MLVYKTRLEIHLQQVILGIDTATDCCSVALYAGKEIYIRQQIAPKRHSSLILQMVHEVLLEVKLTLEDIDLFAVGIGPGSFTGLRLATSVTQGLAYSMQKQISPVSTLKALAQGIYRQLHKKHVIASLDAKMQEVYLGFYEVDDEGIMQTKVADRVWRPPHSLGINSEDPWVLVGTGALLYGADLKEQVPNLDIEINCKYPSALDIVLLAAHHDNRHKIMAHEVMPVYLRDQIF